MFNHDNVIAGVAAAAVVAGVAAAAVVVALVVVAWCWCLRRNCLSCR